MLRILLYAPFWNISLELKSRWQSEAGSGVGYPSPEHWMKAVPFWDCTPMATRLAIALVNKGETLLPRLLQLELKQGAKRDTTLCDDELVRGN